MTTRGSSVRLHRSLKARILASSGIAFFGLALLVAFLLPRVFEGQLRNDLRQRTETSARTVAALLAASRIEDMASMPGGLLQSHGAWLSSQPDLESALVLDADGNVVGRWPDDCPMWFTGKTADGPAPERSSYFLAMESLVLPDGNRVEIAVRASTASLILELESVRWLFASIILLGGAAYFVLTKYLTNTILQPLEDIRHVARSLADGEPSVQFPNLADDEIAELGGFLRTLGDNRRRSRIMQRPEFLATTPGSGEGREDVSSDPEPNTLEPDGV